MPQSGKLTKLQRSLVKELRELADLFSVDYENILAYEPAARTTKLQLMRSRLIRGEVVFWYTYIDELLSHRIIRFYFPVHRGPRLWKTKRFRFFNHHVLEELSLLQKVRFARAVKELSKASIRTIEQLNMVRNGLAHAFFPENLKRSKPIWSGKSLFTLDGARAMDADVRNVVEELFEDFLVYGAS